MKKLEQNMCVHEKTQKQVWENNKKHMFFRETTLKNKFLHKQNTNKQVVQ